MTGQGHKVKIVRIITRLNIGGPAIHTILLSKGIDSAIFETNLVAGLSEEAEGDLSDIAEENKVKVESIPELRREIGLNDFHAFVKIFTILSKDRPDILHTHTAKAGTLGRIAGIFAGVPIKIHTFHGHVFDGYFSPAKTKIFIFIEKILALFTDKIIVVSESVRNEIVNKLKIVPGNKCVVIKLGFDLERFLNNDRLKGVLRKEYDIAPDVLLVGIVGRLVPIKNHRMFLGAVRKIIDGMPDRSVKFLIIGDGELRKDLAEEVKKMALDKDIIFTGWIRDIAKAYADLDVVALTSLNEGTPVSLIEAMASARPVVATSVGGVVDMVTDGKNGLLVDSNDERGLAEKIVCLLKDGKKRNDFGLMGRAFVKGAFHKDRLIKETEDLYYSCLNKGNAKASKR